ncbi:unnamed protein product [Linum trigynum]
MLGFAQKLAPPVGGFHQIKDFATTVIAQEIDPLFDGSDKILAITEVGYLRREDEGKPRQLVLNSSV